jgi:hypothetical protein
MAAEEIRRAVRVEMTANAWAARYTGSLQYLVVAKKRHVAVETIVHALVASFTKMSEDLLSTYSTDLSMHWPGVTRNLGTKAAEVCASLYMRGFI